MTQETRDWPCHGLTDHKSFFFGCLRVWLTIVIHRFSLRTTNIVLLRHEAALRFYTKLGYKEHTHPLETSEKTMLLRKDLFLPGGKASKEG